MKRLLATGWLAITLLIVTTAGVNAAPRVYPLTVVPVTKDGALGLRVSAGGSDAVAFDGTGTEHINIDSGATTSLGDISGAVTRRPAGPNYVVGLSDTEVLRRSVNTGTVERMNIGAPDWSASSDFLDTVVADDAGRYIAFNASNGNLAALRSFVFDMESEALLPWSTSGLTAGDHQSSVVRIGADGSYVLTQDFVTAGALAASRYVRWTLPDGSSTSVSTPPRIYAFGGRWTVSPDLNWTLFPGAQADIVPGLDARVRWYRIDNSTGATDAVPAAASEMSNVQIVNGGRVIFTAGDEPQLFTWDGGSTPVVELSVAPDGTAANATIDIFTTVTTNDDGTRITFASFASNLHAGGTDFERDFYQATLPSLEAEPNEDLSVSGPADAFAPAVRCSLGC